MGKTISDYQQEFDRRAREVILALGPDPTEEERKRLRYCGMAVLTGLEPAGVGELAEVAYECARDQGDGRADLLAEMFFRGFALARFVSMHEEQERTEVVCLN